MSIMVCSVFHCSAPLSCCGRGCASLLRCTEVPNFAMLSGDSCRHQQQQQQQQQAASSSIANRSSSSSSNLACIARFIRHKRDVGQALRHQDASGARHAHQDAAAADERYCGVRWWGGLDVALMLLLLLRWRGCSSSSSSSSIILAV